MSEVKGYSVSEFERMEREIERLRSTALAYLSHSDSGMYRDAAGLRPGASPQAEDLRAVLALKEQDSE